MPINGIETAYKDRYTFAPPSKRQIKAGSVVHFASAIYTSAGILFADILRLVSELRAATGSRIDVKRSIVLCSIKNQGRGASG